MKKFFVLALALVFALFALSGCKKQDNIADSVSQLISDIYYGENEEYKLRANYGFSERIFLGDGKVDKTAYKLTFILMDREADDITYCLVFDYNGDTFRQNFTIDPIKNTLSCSILIDNFALKEFDVKIESGSNQSEVKLQSIVPDGTINYLKALEYLCKSQPDLIANYQDEEYNFNGEIHVRVLVKDQKAYWFIGLHDKNGNLRALLIDGKTGEVLAKREVF